jgi:TonB family protein
MAAAGGGGPRRRMVLLDHVGKRRMKHIVSRGSVVVMRSIYRAILAVVVLPVALANGADVPDPGTLGLRIARQDSGPVFYVDDNTITPAMGMYLDAVKEKVRQCAMRDWPKDRSGRRAPGEVVVRITLRKDGYIRDIQADSVSDGNDALGESVAQLVEGAQPFPPFPAGLLAGYEFIAFGTTIGSSQGTGHQTGKPRLDAQGNNQRLELRSRIPF